MKYKQIKLIYVTAFVQQFWLGVLLYYFILKPELMYDIFIDVGFLVHLHHTPSFCIVFQHFFCSNYTEWLKRNVFARRTVNWTGQKFSRLYAQTYVVTCIYKNLMWTSGLVKARIRLATITIFSSAYHVKKQLLPDSRKLIH